MEAGGLQWSKRKPGCYLLPASVPYLRGGGVRQTQLGGDFQCI